MTKEITKKETNIVLDEKPAFLQGKEARGNENVTTEDMTLPRLKIVQAMSPCLQDDDPSYIEGIKVGQMFNSATKEVYPDSVKICFAYMDVQFILWKDKKKGGGFLGSFDTLEAADSHRGALEDSAYISIDKVHEHYGFLVDTETGQTQDIVLSLSSTGLKVSREINTLVNGSDRFAFIFELSTVKLKNKSNESYQSFKVKQLGYVNEDIYLKGEKVYNTLTEHKKNKALKAIEIRKEETPY